MSILPPVPSIGPQDAKILIVGEAPGREEVNNLQPFVGRAGDVLNACLKEVGIRRESCRITNVVPYQPPNDDILRFFETKSKAPRSLIQATEMAGLNPVRVGNSIYYPNTKVLEGVDNLRREIAATKPNIIVAMGNTALWALSGEWGIGKWRGSQLKYEGIPMVPVLHPAGVLPGRNPAQRHLIPHDLRARVVPYIDTPWEEPDYEFLIQPTLSEVMDYLDEWDSRPDDEGTTADLETRGHQISCLGLGWTETRAMCIPFMSTDKEQGYSYWSEAEEWHIMQRLREIMPRKLMIGQNFLFDLQYIIRFWGVNPRVKFDTMLAQHLLWAGLPKGLDFISAFYCHFHQYWKDEGKTWEWWMPQEQHWTYNCKDVVITHEASRHLNNLIDHYNLREQFSFQQGRLYPAILEMMLRGMPIDKAAIAEFAAQIDSRIDEVHTWIEYVLGHPVNVNSPKQIQTLFYEDFEQQEVKDRKSRKRTTNAEALETIARREPILQPLAYHILAERSLVKFGNDTLSMEFDDDDRLRCSFNNALVETFRFSSSQNAFGTGGNLQNIPRNRDPEDPERPWHAVVHFPEVRKIFIPEPGCDVGDIDLERADAQVVAWDANDEPLKDLFRTGADVHQANAEIIGCSRQDAKRGVHAVNYGATKRVLAMALNISEADAQYFIDKWFEGHPQIAAWHDRVKRDLYTTRTVYNAFGYRRVYFDPIENLLKEALAWIPQSTVGIVINHCLVNLRENVDWVKLHLQVHDSLVFSFPSSKLADINEIRDQCQIVVPYDDPLIIPVNMKGDAVNWGDVHSSGYEWHEAA